MMSVYKEEREKKQNKALNQDNKPLTSKTFAEEELKSENPTLSKPQPK